MCGTFGGNSCADSFGHTTIKAQTFVTQRHVFVPNFTLLMCHLKNYIVRCAALTKRVVSKRVAKGWFPKGWFWRMFPGTKKLDEGIFGCSRYQKRNEGTFACSLVPKTGTRAHLPKPAFYDTALVAFQTQMQNRSVLATHFPKSHSCPRW